MDLSNFKSHLPFGALVAALGVSLSPIANATTVDFGIDSKYVSEGRDNLNGSAIAWTNINTQAAQNWSFNLAYGYALESVADYDELNLTAAYNGNTEHFSYYADYTRLEFFKGDASDNEFGFGLRGNQSFDVMGQNLYWFTDYVYSTEAEGGFLDLGVDFNHQLSDKLTMTPYTKLGINMGYASTLGRGVNHLSIGSSFKYKIDSHLNLTFLIEHNVRDDGADVFDFGDATWVGVHFTYTK